MITFVIAQLNTAKSKRKLPGEWISDFNFTYDMPQLILFLVTSIFRLALK